MLGRDFNSRGMETCRGSIPPPRRPSPAPSCPRHADASHHRGRRLQTQAFPSKHGKHSINWNVKFTVGRARLRPCISTPTVLEATQRRTRACNLLLRREAPYPLGHTGTAADVGGASLGAALHPRRQCCRCGCRKPGGPGAQPLGVDTPRPGIEPGSAA